MLILWKRYNFVVHKKNNEMFFAKLTKVNSVDGTACAL
jgi:hypothetical protein